MFNKIKFTFGICVVAFILDSFINEIEIQGMPLSIIQEKFNKSNTIEDFDENKNNEQLPILTRALKDSAQLWTGGMVYYEFEDNFPQEQKNKIIIAMNSIKAATCIKFQSKASGRTQNYITYRILYKRRKGCYSSIIGRAGDPQYIVLSIDYCDDGTNYAGTAVHEIMHALGFHHEFQRGDRENYITFHKENLADESSKSAFDEYPQDLTLGVPFNYKSIMQYDPRTGAYMYGVYVFTERKEFPDRIPPLGKFANMGQDCVISAGDRRMIDSAYKDECGLKSVTNYTMDYPIPGTDCNEKLEPMMDMKK